MLTNLTLNMNTATKKFLSAAMRWCIAAGFTVLLLWVLFRKVDFAEMTAILRNGVDYQWILAAMALSVLSHMIRARRWQLQLRALGITPPYMALCCSIFGCYALNIVFPRLGDIWRCTYIAKRQKAQFTTVLGSMVSDRLADTVTVLLLFLLTLLLANSAISAFLEKYPLGRGVIELLYSPWFWGAGVLLAAALWLAYRHWRDTRIVERLRQWCAELWQGFASVATMKNRGMFLLLTLLLWGCYFTQLYVAFFAFPFTTGLCTESSLGYGLIPCLVAFVLSSIAMGIPSNGGLGPWNIAIMFGLAIYGVTDAQGTTFSMLQWSGQTVMLILLGLFTIAYILLSRRTHVRSQPAATNS